MAGLNAARHLLGQGALTFPRTTMLGALLAYISGGELASGSEGLGMASSGFQPMKPNFGLFPPLDPPVRKKRERYEDLLKAATPDGIQAHLAYRRKNAERYTAAHWDAEYSVTGLRLGVDLEGQILYLVHDDLNDDDNPVVFSFDQITGYELYRMMKKVDSADDPGETALESGLSKMATVAKLVSSKSSNSNDYFNLLLTTTDPYWPSIELKFFTSSSWLYVFGCYAQQMKTI